MICSKVIDDTYTFAFHLSQVLHDPPALAYFIQYLEARDAVQQVKFWLDVESFRSSSANIISSNLVSSSNPPPNKTDLEHVGAAQVTDKLDSAEDNEEISFTETDEDRIVEKSSILENPEKDVSRAEVLAKVWSAQFIVNLKEILFSLLFRRGQRMQ